MAQSEEKDLFKILGITLDDLDDEYLRLISDNENLRERLRQDIMDVMRSGCQTFMLDRQFKLSTKKVSLLTGYLNDLKRRK